MSFDLVGWCASVLLGLLVCLTCGLFGVLDLIVGMLLWVGCVAGVCWWLVVVCVVAWLWLCCVVWVAWLFGDCVLVNSVVVVYILGICCDCLVVLVCLFC